MSVLGTLAAPAIIELLKQAGSVILPRVAKTGRVGEVIAEIAKNAGISATPDAVKDLAVQDPAAFSVAVQATEKTAAARWAAILAETTSASWFVSGARPAALWACVAILVYAGLVVPFGNWIVQLVGYVSGLADLPALVPPPSIAWETLVWLLPLLYGIRAGEGAFGVKRNSL